MKNFTNHQRNVPKNIAINVTLNAAFCQGTASFSSMPKTFQPGFFEKILVKRGPGFSARVASGKARASAPAGTGFLLSH